MIKKLFKYLFFILATLVTLTIVCVFIYVYFPPEHQERFPKYQGWDNDHVRHILPTVSHDRLSIKISLDTILSTAPVLFVGKKQIIGKKTDNQGRFWKFETRDLQPDVEYLLSLRDSHNNPLCDSWPIKTFPHPDSTTVNLKVLAYTCAGGAEQKFLGKEIFLEMKYRHGLLDQALKQKPDLVIVNGDHIYWDRRSLDNNWLKRLIGKRLDHIYGHLDLSKPMLAPENHLAFISICDAQIAALYGCLFRSTPVFFIGDDHDLFENDEAREDLVSLPPKGYMIDGATTTQELYYPQLTLDHKGHEIMEMDLSDFGYHPSFGSIRYGDLFEAILFDAKRYLTLDGDNAVMVPTNVEDYIKFKNIDSKSRYLFHVPSSPFGYTAGKWAEWYPDVIVSHDDSVSADKFMWQKGWWLQHQRILEYMSESNRPSFIIQGDLHNLSFGELKRSGHLTFDTNPIYVIGVGPLGSGTFGFPSAFRGTPALVPNLLEMNELLKPLEKNGFTIIDISKEKIEFDLFAWRPIDGAADLKNMKPVFEYSFAANTH